MMNRWISFVVLATFAFSIGCSTCSDDGPKGSELKESHEVEGTEQLLWETISLGISVDDFKIQISRLAGMSSTDVQERMSCSPQFEIDVFDPEKAEITERIAKDGAILGCAFLQVNQYKSWELTSVRGLLMDNRLVSVTYRFKSDGAQDIESALVSRFGKGEYRDLVKRSILGDSPSKVHFWRVENSIWAFQQHQNDISLTRQVSDKLLQLPVPKEASNKGEAVNIDALGFTGDININLDDIAVPDDLDLADTDSTLE